QLKLADIVSGGARFGASLETVTANLGGGTTLTDANLFQFALDNLQLAIGAGGDGLQITSGALGIAHLSQGNQSWIAAIASGLPGRPSIGGGTVKADLTGGALKVNRGSTDLNWHDAFAAPLDPGTLLNPAATGLTLDFTAPIAEATGTLTALDLAGFISGSG